MTNKFTIGSQWLTKGGWRAVVVDITKLNTPIVWHSHDYDIWFHVLDGTCTGGDKFTLDKPYTEPRKGTVWVLVEYDKKLDVTSTRHFDEYQDFDYAVNYITHKKTDTQIIASFKHDWVEGDVI